MGDVKPNATALLLKAVVWISVSIPLLGALLFLPAGTWHYWQAWVYLAIFFPMVISVTVYLVKHDPELLERRMRRRETEPAQRRIMRLALLVFPAVFLVPGFDRRYGWSHIPVPLVLISDLGVILSYAFMIYVMLVNRYASRVIEVEAGQQVISTGPYAIVRHPMYLGGALMYLFTPIALGSYWGLIPGILLVLVLVARILNEEEVLKRKLPGYPVYMQKVRYRLIPGIW